jgi:hypothetical protein
MNRALENVELFGLLYLTANEKSVNVNTKSTRDILEVYLYNAVALSNSLRQAGVRFTLLTNNKSALEKEAPAGSINIKEITFSTVVPSGVNFYSAHFKIDAFNYLAILDTPYVGLCDLDMLCINKAPQSFINNVISRVPMCYDITDQVLPAYGCQALITTIKKISDINGDGRWLGGEFISGSPSFFGELVQLINHIYPNYLKNVKDLHHQGDEAITSAAVLMMRNNGKCIVDAGSLGIVGRYWNRPVAHPQKPFDWFQRCFLLHLPADKRFLEKIGRGNKKSSVELLRDYVSYSGSLLSTTKNKLRHIKADLQRRFSHAKNF